MLLNRHCLKKNGLHLSFLVSVVSLFSQNHQGTLSYLLQWIGVLLPKNANKQEKIQNHLKVPLLKASFLVMLQVREENPISQALVDFKQKLILLSATIPKTKFHSFTAKKVHLSLRRQIA